MLAGNIILQSRDLSCTSNSSDKVVFWSMFMFVHAGTFKGCSTIPLKSVLVTIYLTNELDKHM